MSVNTLLDYYERLGIDPDLLDEEPSLWPDGGDDPEYSIAATKKQTGLDMNTVAYVMDDGPTRKGHDQIIVTNSSRTPVPHFFRVACATATRGGIHSYETPGYELATRVNQLPPPGIEARTWVQQVGRLKVYAKQHRTDRMWAWMHRYYPGYMRMVPTRARRTFCMGIAAAARSL